MIERDFHGLPTKVIPNRAAAQKRVGNLRHGKGEFSRDEDDDGFYEVHVNTIERRSRSLLRSQEGAGKPAD